MAPDSKSPPRSLSAPLPFITVMMPAFNEEAYIRESLLSLISTDYPKDRMEIIVADGNSTDRTREEVAIVSAKHSFIKVINNPHRLPSYGCNLAAKHAFPETEYLIRVDAHSKWPQDFIRQCVMTAIHTNADLVVFANSPISVSPFQRAAAYALQHRFGSGNSLYRLGFFSGWANHGQHGCFTKNIWMQSGGYTETLDNYPNEDVDLSFKIANLKGKIWLNSKLKMYYFPRRNISELARQYFEYGKSRVRTHLRRKRFFSFRQFIPALYLIVLFCSFFVFLENSGVFTLILLCPYVVSLIFVTCTAILKKSDSNMLRLLYIIPCMHFCFALGILFQVFRSLINSIARI